MNQNLNKEADAQTNKGDYLTKVKIRKKEGGHCLLHHVPPSKNAIREVITEKNACLAMHLQGRKNNIHHPPLTFTTPILFTSGIMKGTMLERDHACGMDWQFVGLILAMKDPKDIMHLKG